jgi:hypothetical protein
MILASGRSNQKLSSNGLGLAELEPKQANHRQIPIEPVEAKSSESPCNVAAFVVNLEPQSGARSLVC